MLHFMYVDSLPEKLCRSRVIKCLWSYSCVYLHEIELVISWFHIYAFLNKIELCLVQYRFLFSCFMTSLFSMQFSHLCFACEVQLCPCHDLHEIELVLFHGTACCTVPLFILLFYDFLIFYVILAFMLGFACEVVSVFEPTNRHLITHSYSWTLPRSGLYSLKRPTTQRRGELILNVRMCQGGPQPHMCSYATRHTMVDSTTQKRHETEWQSSRCRCNAQVNDGRTDSLHRTLTRRRIAALQMRNL
jgi:hypothetical protein